MLTPGKKNKLEVIETMPMGVIACLSENTPCDNTKMEYENINNDDARVFIPYQQGDLALGDIVDAFVYYNEEGELQASLEDIKVEIGSFVSLKIKSIINAGAFLEWQLKPDLFMPRAEMHSQLNENMPVVVTVKHDPYKSQLIASSKIERYLDDSPSTLDLSEEVSLLVYAETPLGYKAIVNQSFSGLIYKNELSKALRIGQHIKGYIKQRRPDGKIDLQLYRHDKKARQTLAEQIMEDLDAHGGISSLTDKSAPDDIYQRFSVSKGAYKKALGELYKARKIIILKDMIKKTEKK